MKEINGMPIADVKCRFYIRDTILKHEKQGGGMLFTGRAFSHPAGNSPVMIDFNSVASSAYIFSYSANLAFHSASRAAPAGI